MSSPGFAVAVQFHVKPSSIDEFLSRVQQQASDSVEREPGCLQFDVLVDEANPHLVFLYETYVDAAAFEAHRATEHFADFNETVTPWVETKQVMRLMIQQAISQPPGN